jgi:CheY-like chemotaxis protein
MSSDKPRLLAIVELGGYPNFTSLYRCLGFEASFVNSQRKAQAYLKKQQPDVIVTEFNFQSDFRDRTSNLETLMARLQRYPGVRVIVLYPSEFTAKFEQLRKRFPIAAALAFPVSPEDMERALLDVKPK